MDSMFMVCPFSTLPEILRCKGSNCTFHDGDICTAFRGASEDHVTLGKECPLMLWGKCRRGCDYSNAGGGCTFLE